MAGAIRSTNFVVAAWEGDYEAWLRLLIPRAEAHAPAMFTVTAAEAAAIRQVFERDGELSATTELRRLFPGIIDNAQAREWVRTIAS